MKFEFKVINGSSHIEDKKLPKFILKEKPPFSETSFQHIDGTNVGQWHYRTQVFWKPYGPLFIVNPPKEIDEAN